VILTINKCDNHEISDWINITSIALALPDEGLIEKPEHVAV
jgi:hypothetical protein